MFFDGWFEPTRDLKFYLNNNFFCCDERETCIVCGGKDSWYFDQDYQDNIYIAECHNCGFKATCEGE